jgi:5'(3')-deoxyribonucleotidase
VTRPVVLLDVDGVLGNFIEANLRTLRSLGVERCHDDVTTYDLEHCLRLDDTTRALMEFRWGLPGFCASIPPYPGAQDAVDRLRTVADVYALTAPMFTATWQHERTEWLVEHFGFRRKDVISTHAKHLVRGDVFVDDKPSHVEAWQAAHPGGVGILWGRPYNVGAVGGVRRETEWGAVVGLLTEAGR